jgi:hypothetical protein
LSVLDLGNDLDMLSILAKDLANCFNVLTTSNKRSEDHVYIVFDTKSKISLILLRERREIDISVWEIDTLLRRDLAIVAGADTDSLRVNDLEDIKGKHTVVNIDDTAGFNDFGDVLVVDIPRRYS